MFLSVHVVIMQVSYVLLLPSVNVDGFVGREHTGVNIPASALSGTVTQLVRLLTGDDISLNSMDCPLSRQSSLNKVSSFTIRMTNI